MILTLSLSEIKRKMSNAPINTCIKEVRFFYFCFKKLNIKEYDGCSSNTSPDQYIHVSTKTDYFYFYLKKLNIKNIMGAAATILLYNSDVLIDALMRIAWGDACIKIEII